MNILKTIFSFSLLFQLFFPQPQYPNKGVISAPVLKWQYGGCYSSWCETGWYSSPAAVDLDQDGDIEIVAGAYTIFMLDGATGADITSAKPSSSRNWPSIVAADIDNNGDIEIVTAHGNGYLHVLDHNLSLVWTRQPTPGNELRSLAVYDVDSNGDLEILVASTRSDDQWFVYEHNGDLRSGDWPQQSPDSDYNGYAAGCFNQNIAVGDMDNDGIAEIIGTNDTHYTSAFAPDGSQLPASTIFGTRDDGSPKPWSRVGFHVDHEVDLRGYAHCGEEHRPNFAHSPPILADLDGNGTLEEIMVGNVYNCGVSPYESLYEMPFIFNKDRTRWNNGTYDWTVLPTPDSAALSDPLIENYNVIESVHPNPVAADLDNDGIKEVLYPSYDGRMHVYWMDKTEHGNWPFWVNQSGEGFYRFATEPVVADLDNDGYAEVIFASWVQKETNQTGKLHILDYLGNPIHEISLPAAYGSPNWNGVLAAPTLANIDSDADLEIVLNSAHSGVLAYDLPNTANARVLWETGRGNLLRSGSPINGDISQSYFSSSHPISEAGDIVHFTLTLKNVGEALPAVTISNTLPASLTYHGGLTASVGSAVYNAGTITWSDSVGSNSTVTITYDAVVDAGITGPTLLLNPVLIQDGMGNSYERSAATYVNGLAVYLPLIER